MNFINFPESNLPLRAGKGNENTKPMRVMQCEHPDYKSNPTFYVGKFEFSDEEKAFIRHEIDKATSRAGAMFTLTNKQLDIIIHALPELWVNSMHAWSPLILSVAHPFEMGYKKVIINRPQDN
jgi:hypothetical protein